MKKIAPCMSKSPCHDETCNVSVSSAVAFTYIFLFFIELDCVHRRKAYDTSTMITTIAPLVQDDSHGESPRNEFPSRGNSRMFYSLKHQSLRRRNKLKKNEMQSVTKGFRVPYRLALTILIAYSPNNSPRR
jgi:hypothetical protein